MADTKSPKLLILNDFYCAAGAETVFRDYSSILVGSGYKVKAFFGCISSKSGPFESILNVFLLYLRILFAFLRTSQKPDYVIIHNFLSRLTVFIFLYLYILKFFFNSNCKIFHVLHDYGLLCPSSGYFYYTHPFAKFSNASIDCFSVNASLVSLLFSRVDIRSAFHDLYKKIRWIITFLFFRPYFLDGFISPSPFIRSFFLGKFPSIPNHLIYNPLGSLALNQHHSSSPITHASKRPLSIALLGRNSPEKGLNSFIEYVSLISQSLDVHFFVSLDDPDIHEISKRLMHHNLYFHGFLDRNDLHLMLSCVDIIIVPSLWFENAPLVIVESLSLGIPVLVRKFGSLATFSIDSSNVYYYNDFHSFENFFLNIANNSVPFDFNDVFLARFSNSCFVQNISFLFTD